MGGLLPDQLGHFRLSNRHISHWDDWHFDGGTACHRLAALVAEDVGRNPGKIRAKIQQTADDLGQRGTDPFYGKGRINVGTYATD